MVSAFLCSFFVLFCFNNFSLSQLHFILCHSPRTSPHPGRGLFSDCHAWEFLPVVFIKAVGHLRQESPLWFMSSFSQSCVNFVAFSFATECPCGEGEGILNCLPLERSFNNFCNKIFWCKKKVSSGYLKKSLNISVASLKSVWSIRPHIFVEYGMLFQSSDSVPSGKSCVIYLGNTPTSCSGSLLQEHQ